MPQNEVMAFDEAGQGFDKAPAPPYIGRWNNFGS
jgi:hypothetical protein